MSGSSVNGLIQQLSALREFVAACAFANAKAAGFEADDGWRSNLVRTHVLVRCGVAGTPLMAPISAQ
jgi:hypothetical protein